MSRDCQCPTGNEARAGGDCIHPTCPRDPPVSYHSGGPVAMDFNDGSRIIFDETHLFARGIRVNPRGWGKTAEHARQMAERMGEAMGDAARAMQAIVDSLPTVPIVPFARERLNGWAIEADPGEEYDTRQRALEARRNRNTGPARPSVANARRPRRHQ